MVAGSKGMTGSRGGDVCCPMLGEEAGLGPAVGQTTVLHGPGSPPSASRSAVWDRGPLCSAESRTYASRFCLWSPGVS